MATILLGETRSEFLAIPTLVRFLLDADGNLSLAVKARAMQLKYFVAADSVSLLFLPLEQGGLAYAITMPDDPDDWAYVWSTIDSDNEVAALNAFLDGSPCSLHLFNEIAINVASTPVQIDGLAVVSRELRAGQHLQKVPPDLQVPQARVVQGLDALQRGVGKDSSGWRLDVQLSQTWDHAKSWYYSNGRSTTYLSLFDRDDGAQQEALCLWLTDTFAPEGAYLNPEVTRGEAKEPRELCDVLLTAEGHTFIIESKALAVLTREKLPTRDDLHDDVVKHIIKKGVKQVSGAVRSLRLGYPVRDHLGNEVSIHREGPMHLIILVPDLTLLSASDNLGNVFLARLIQKTDCYVHLLDPTQLLRVVQAATMIARRSPGVSEIAALNWYLIKRVERALNLDTPDFDFLLRFDDDDKADATPPSS
ncbi:hypothetical protein BKG77_16670 [Mycobacteroides chelonae]|uniref:hypothetical protein n=1 Tax=Mycobacteroides chelonae TaxID=1774 RepID=UPI0008A8BA98|nr:hypothetical protein [Mycobacteroides chelonae]OHU25015.1 hypothetical protein BKG77_16670 [Mycobacteroides chelonae]